MLRNIAYFLILGKPVIMYLGILTLSSFLFTAYIGAMNLRGKTKIPLKWHFRMAKISIALAFIHGILGLSAYFGW
ncbi:MAG: hypothetical protein A3J63_01905 [Candidatus Moranbacteria bacterium RIFCSPHIGHO2_02_FULL_40_12b]|nr:MAG: hypothetical protein A3J63_01905 [Candidatus Moranbacteria bacterium RIFCSPHIGHO2_02_FULL_40_12b]OGI23384.1 MAG: hypothetical protein A3E91_02410 [Candidatus Moranbacteria bacterium RIFCSPHIGHO2_12_FULL_40_10]